MASYTPASFYPCPWRASDIFKPQPPPPPTYYLRDHVRVVYNDGDWPEDEGGFNEEQNKHAYDHIPPAETVRAKLAVVPAPPLGLLSVRIREYNKKGESGRDRPDQGNISKEEQFASLGRCSVHFLVFYSPS
jgi:hypothetical protein